MSFIDFVFKLKCMGIITEKVYEEALKSHQEVI